MSDQLARVKRFFTGNIDHKIWGAVPMIMEGMYPDIVLLRGWCTF